jgi:hypothetical protein
MAEPLQDPTRKFVAKRGQRAPGKNKSQKQDAKR